MDIDGKTRLVGIVGYPLGHTLSPAMHNAAFAALGLNNVYVPVEIRPEDFHSVVEDLARAGFLGFNVTMPYKEDVLTHLDDVASYAQIAGAVNTVQCVDGRLVGYNTDGRGFIAAIEQDAGFEVKGSSAVVFGAGGAACAAVLSLALAGAAAISIVNRDVERAERLAERVRQRFSSCDLRAMSPSEALAEAMSQATLLVNATPVGMKASPGTPLDPALVSAEHLVVDMVYDPLETEFLAAARKKGARTMNGLGMLVYQAASAFEIWTEREAPVDVMRKAAEAQIERLSTASVPSEVEIG